jgi:uncharacterized protein (TIGR00251 family)
VIDYTLAAGKLKFGVRVVPRASRSEIIGEHEGLLRIRIAAPPVDGAANEELIKVLAKQFKVSKSCVDIVSGHSARVKQVTVTHSEFSSSDVATFFNGRD